MSPNVCGGAAKPHLILATCLRQRKEVNLRQLIAGIARLVLSDKLPLRERGGITAKADDKMRSGQGGHQRAHPGAMARSAAY